MTTTTIIIITTTTTGSFLPFFVIPIFPAVTVFRRWPQSLFVSLIPRDLLFWPHGLQDSHSAFTSPPRFPIRAAIFCTHPASEWNRSQLFGPLSVLSLFQTSLLKAPLLPVAFFTAPLAPHSISFQPVTPLLWSLVAWPDLSWDPGPRLGCRGTSGNTEEAGP